MAENIPKKISIPDLAVGVAIGFFFGYLIAKNTITGTTSISNATNSNSNSSLLSQLSSMNIGIRQLSNRLAIIEARLGIPSPYIQPQVQPQEIPIPVPLKQIMENEENFELKKDDKGRMLGFTAHRKLFETE